VAQARDSEERARAVHAWSLHAAGVDRSACARPRALKASESVLGVLTDLTKISGHRPLYVNNTTEEEVMNATRLTALLVTLVSASALFAASDTWAQNKYTISRAPSANGQYLQEHAIDVDDPPGHQVRIYEIRYDYPGKDLAFAGVTVKQTLTRGMSDYVNWSGPFTTYSVYTLEDGSKVFSRSTGTTQTDADGTRKFTFVESYVGGTGKFKGIRGQVRGSGERAPGAKSLSQQSSGEYWIEE
jgi:hypothetical protein